MSENEIVCYLIEFDAESFDSIPYKNYSVAKKEMKHRKRQTNDKEVVIVRKEHFDDFCMDYMNLFMY